MSNESADDPTDYVLVAYEKGTDTPVGRSIMTFTSREGAERAMDDDSLRARYKDVDLKIEEFTGDHTSVYGPQGAGVVIPLPPAKTYRVLVPIPQQVREYFQALTDIAEVKQVFDDVVVITLTTEDDEYELGRLMLALETTLWNLGGWDDTPKVSRPKEITGKE